MCADLHHAHILEIYEDSYKLKKGNGICHLINCRRKYLTGPIKFKLQLTPQSEHRITGTDASIRTLRCLDDQLLAFVPIGKTISEEQLLSK